MNWKPRMWEAIAPHVNGDIKERNVGEDYALETDDSSTKRKRKNLAHVHTHTLKFSNVVKRIGFSRQRN